MLGQAWTRKVLFCPYVSFFFIWYCKGYIRPYTCLHSALQCYDDVGATGISKVNPFGRSVDCLVAQYTAQPPGVEPEQPMQCRNDLNYYRVYPYALMKTLKGA